MAEGSVGSGFQELGACTQPLLHSSYQPIWFLYSFTVQTFYNTRDILKYTRHSQYSNMRQLVYSTSDIVQYTKHFTSQQTFYSKIQYTRHFIMEFIRSRTVYEAFYCTPNILQYNRYISDFTFYSAVHQTS